MINFKQMFYKRFEHRENFNEIYRIARERREIIKQKDEKISALAEENTKLVEDVQAKKERIFELCIENNNLIAG